MTIPTWPVGVPTAPLRDGWSVDALDNTPLSTEMNAGTTRERQKYSLQIATVKMAIKMKPGELSSFHTFWRITLMRGVARFTMPVWTGTAFVTKTCKILKGAVSERIVGPDNTVVSFTLLVESYTS